MRDGILEFFFHSCKNQPIKELPQNDFNYFEEALFSKLLKFKHINPQIN